MSSIKDKYRNPPTPLGYIKKKPDIVLKEKNDVNDINIIKLIDLVIESDIWDEPDLSIYEHFTINSDSDTEEVIEIPFVPCPKKVEVVDVEDDVTPESLDDILIKIKKEDAPEDHATAETSEDLEQESKVLATYEHLKISEKTDSSSIKSDKISPVKKTKKHDQGHKRSSRSKKIKERRDSHNSCDSDSNSGKRSASKGKKDSERERSRSKSRYKRKRNYDSVSNSHGKSRHKRKESCDSSGNDSHTSQDKRREGYDSENNSHTSRHKRRESYDSENDSCTSRHKRREGYNSDDDSHKRRGDTRDNSSGGRKVYKRSDSERDKDSKSNFKLANQKQDYLSDDSEYSSVRNVRMRSPSPCSSKEYERTVRSIKQEKEDKPDLLFGEYPCKVCQVMMNSYGTYQSHLLGKRHKKNLDAQKAAERVSTAVCVSEEASKCPKPPPGYYRVKQDGCIANIQPLLNEQLVVPSPGLDNVIEIHGPSETTYHCKLCNCNCSGNSLLPHLNGYKHRIFCLKHFRIDLYEMWYHKPKYAIEKDLAGVLRDIEKKFGRGVVTVEKDFEESDKTDEFPSSSTRDFSKSSTSAGSYSENYINYSKPDPTKSGFFCKLCNSHSNSEAMWHSHIVGKRHLANVKKAPGTAPSKSKYIPASGNVRPHLFVLLDRQNPDHEPVVGLNQIREIRKPDIDGVTYNCFLCGCCISSLEIVDHILSKKHREKYLDNIKHPELETLRLCQVSESYRESIIYEICERVEKERGCGQPEVYYAKNAVLRG